MRGPFATGGAARRITRAVRAGIDTDPVHGAVVPPLHLSSNFSFAGFGVKRAHDYTRTSNPTRDQLGAAIAELEGGAAATITASGMAAVLLALQLVPPGARVLAPHDCYGGTHRLLRCWHERGQLDVHFVDLGDADAVAGAMGAPFALLWIETPSNPLLRVYDIAELAERARAAGALTVVDNTFSSPVLQQPLALGADLVVHSTTKYLNGHSDVVGGAVVARDAELGARCAWWANCLGLTGAPFDSYMTLRGLRTLGARMRVHEENARTLAHWLAAHPLVHAVHWPGLTTHPQHALARRQQQGFGAMLSCELAEGLSLAGFVEALQHWTLAESLGGVESLVAHPATMTHAAMDAAARARAGIGERLLRFSVGIEDVRDLQDDLAQAFEHAAARGRGSAASRPEPRSERPRAPAQRPV